MNAFRKNKDPWYTEPDYVKQYLGQTNHEQCKEVKNENLSDSDSDGSVQPNNTSTNGENNSIKQENIQYNIKS